MTFERSWVALIALIPIVWWILRFRAVQRPWGLLLKALAVACVLLALAEPTLDVFETRVAVGVLVDTSQSVPAASLERASQFATTAAGARGRNEVHLFPFAREIRPVSEAESEDGYRLRTAAGEAGRSTDLEGAIQEALGALPSGLIPRLVLLSDGNENAGSVTRAAWQARDLGVPVDTVALEGRPEPQLHLETLSLPSEAYSGERFPVDLDLVSPDSQRVDIELSAEGKQIGVSRIGVHPGSNPIRVYASLHAVGSVELSGKVTASGQSEIAFTQALNLRKPKALIVSNDPPGALDHLTSTLHHADFDLGIAHTADVPGLDRFQVIVLNNWDQYEIEKPVQTRLEEFVERGGGLLYIAGEKSVYQETKQEELPLERALPARIAPPRSPKGNCVVLIVDKSSSMEGRKMELARVAAIGVIDNLRPIDLVGVLIFDNSFEWTVPIRKARNSSLIKRLVSGITPDGGTQIAPALEEAYRRTLPAQAVVKHIVLLTDGISEEGNSIPVSREAGDNKVTISTIGLGQDVNRAYLEKIASLSGGKSYFLNDPSGLQQILLRDVMEYTGTTAIEKEVKPRVIREAEILKGVDIAAAPPLEGYVKFESKTAAERILDIDREDPLFVRWQFGLGRSAVFTSDAKSRWATKWIGWPGFDAFWANVFRDLLPHARGGEATARFDSANAELVVDYRLAPHISAPSPLPEIYVLGPDNFRQPLDLRKMAQGAYQGRVPIENRRGLFRILPLKETPAFPEVGIYRQETELADYATNSFLLQQIASFTGGRFGVDPRQIFRTDGRAIESSMRLWPGLLALALLLNLAELIIRKWSGILAFFRERKAGPAHAV